MLQRRWGIQHGINHAEHRRVDRDSESERAHGRDGERPLACEHARREAHIASKSRKSEIPALFERVLFDLLNAPEGESGSATRLSGSYTLTNEIFRLELDVGAQLLLQLLLDRRLVNERCDTLPQGSQW
jgi:hypothetical protein